MKTEKGKATVIIPLLYVEGYQNRVYRGKNGPVVIYGRYNCDTWGAEATRKLGKIMHKLYGRISPEDVEKVYLYVNAYAMKCALLAAKKLAGRGSKLEFVAGNSDDPDEDHIIMGAANRMRAEITWTNCGGTTLGEIVDRLVKKTKRSRTIDDWSRSSEAE